MQHHILFFVLFVLTACSTAAENLTIRLLHTNDLHAHLIPWRSENDNCIDSSDCLGGFSRLQTQINQERQRFPELILLDAGDRFSGTAFYTLRKSKDIARLMARMRYDAMIPGNHDFDDGLPELTRFIDNTHIPFLAANVTFPPNTSLSRKTRPGLTLYRNGTAIGLIGVLTEETKTSSGKARDITILPPLPIIRHQIEDFKKQGVSIIILLSHLGMDEDIKIANACPDIDIIVGGHSHTLLSNKNLSPRTGGTYPKVITHPDGTKTLIVTAGYGGHYLGTLSVTFNPDGRIISYQGDTIPLDKTIPADSETEKIISEAQTSLDKILNTPLFTLETPLPQTPGQTFCTESCAVGEVLADALLAAAGQADIAFLNAGGIRSALPAGMVTVQHMVQTYPFDSEAVTVDLTGREIQAFLTHGLTDYRSDDRTNAFLQTAGLSYTFSENDKKPLNVRTPEGPLLPDKTYTVVLPSFLADGGDGFPPQPHRHVIFPSVREALIRSLSRIPPKSFQNRIQKKEPATP